MGFASEITSWDFQDLDWANPDPLDARYMQAICNAAIERWQKVNAASTNTNRTNTVNINLCKQYYENGNTGWLYSQTDLTSIYTAIANLYPYFINTNINGNANTIKFQHSNGYGSYVSHSGATAWADSGDRYAGTFPYSGYLALGDWYEFRTLNTGINPNPTSRYRLKVTDTELVSEKYGEGTIQVFDWRLSVWNESDMMKAIGATRVESKVNVINPKAWLVQMYSILNKLTMFGGGYSGIAIASDILTYSPDAGLNQKYGYRYRYFNWDTSGVATGGNSYPIYDPETYQIITPCPSISALWSEAVFIGGGGGLVASSSYENTYGVDGIYQEKYSRVRGTPTIGFTGSWLMANAVFNAHLECMKVSRAGYEFFMEDYAEDSFIPLEFLNGSNGQTKSISVGDHESCPPDGTMQYPDMQGAPYQDSYASRGWWVQEKYVFDTEFGNERNWTNATVDTATCWNFKA